MIRRIADGIPDINSVGLKPLASASVHYCNWLRNPGIVDLDAGNQITLRFSAAIPT